MFMHDVVSGSNATAVLVASSSRGGGGGAPSPAFGDTRVIDDLLTETSSPASAAVGRAQGMYTVSSLSGTVLTVVADLVLTAGPYNGSTVAVVGRDDVRAGKRELTVVGGTGRFRMATGYAVLKTASAKGLDATVELDVYVVTTTATTAAPRGSSCPEILN